MLPSPLTIAPVGAVTAASPAVAIGDGRQAAFQRALQTLVGQSVTGEVLSRFNDGSFMVNVVEHAVRMQLPADASVGSRLPLTVLSAEPRATFELNQPSSSVVLYGEAHAPAGTDDLYAPAHAASPPAASPAGASSASTAASSAGNASTAHSATASASGNAALAAQAGTAAGKLSDLSSAAAAAYSAPASLSAAPAGYPASAALTASLLAGAGLASTTAYRASNPLSPDAPSSAEADDLHDAPSTASSRAGGNSSASSAASDVDHHAAGAAARASATRAQHAAASLLGKAPLTALADLPGLDAGTSQPELSTAARLLGTLLNQPAASAALPLLGKTALFGKTPPDTAQLAQTLQNNVEESGLFYESHVAAWSRGERTLEQLQREPQMQQSKAGELATPGLPDRTAAQQINQQLLTHEQGRVLWQGETWPGQPMQWDIRRQPDQGQQGRASSDAAPPPVWRSNLKLRFAALGELSVAITMVGQQVHLQLNTDDAATGSTLRTQAATLEQSMAAAGIPLSSLQISDGESHDG